MSEIEQLNQQLEQIEKDFKDAQSDYEFYSKRKGYGGGSISAFFYAKDRFIKAKEKYESSKDWIIGKIKRLSELQENANVTSEIIEPKEDEMNIDIDLSQINDWTQIPF